MSECFIFQFFSIALLLPAIDRRMVMALCVMAPTIHKDLLLGKFFFYFVDTASGHIAVITVNRKKGFLHRLLYKCPAKI